MTSVVIFPFRDKDEGACIVAMADTRYMTQDNNGQSLRTSIDAGSKIFSIPFRVARGYGFIAGEKPEYFINSSFGVAFAGNTTIGLNLAGALSQICAFLECHENSCNTNLSSIAEFAAKFLTDWHQKYNNWGSWTHACEVAIFGICPADLKPHAFHLKPGQSSLGVWEVQSSEFNFLNPLSEVYSGNLYNSDCHPWLILGDHRTDIEQLIKARVEDVIGIGSMSANAMFQIQLSPQYVLEAAVIENFFPTIGHGVQILFADDRGARPMRWIRPQGEDVPNEEYEWFSYLGYNVDQLRGIGNAQIGDPGGFPPAYKPPTLGTPRFTEFNACLDRVLKRYSAVFL